MNLPKNSEQSKAIVYLVIGLVVVVLAIILFKKFLRFGEGTLEFLNIKDTKEEKENNAAVSSNVNREQTKGNNSYWSPNFYKAAPSGSKLVTRSTGESIAKQFWDSVGYVYDTPSEGMAAVKRCSTGSQLSLVADIFNQKYKLDLLTWLQNKYDTSEQKEILADMLRYANNLPRYK